MMTVRTATFDTKNFSFSTHSVFMLSEWFWQQTAIIYLFIYTRADLYSLPTVAACKVRVGTYDTRSLDTLDTLHNLETLLLVHVRHRTGIHTSVSTTVRTVHRKDGQLLETASVVWKKCSNGQRFAWRGLFLWFANRLESWPLCFVL